MLRVTPIREDQADGQIREIYDQIKTDLHSTTVPVVFQYLAAFPEYLSFLWKQASLLVHDQTFQSQSKHISEFALLAMQTCYVPSSDIISYLSTPSLYSLRNDLLTSVDTLAHTQSIQYFIALAVRESLKGQYLGLKQIGWSLSDEQQKDFFSMQADLSDKNISQAQTENGIHTSSQNLSASKNPSVIIVPYRQFFSRMEKEMKNLQKKETYLTRRVEMERFSLAKLQLLQSPLDSSFVSVTRRSVDHPHFADLIYLLSDVFPTETPYKLLLSSIMRLALSYRSGTDIQRKDSID